MTWTALAPVAALVVLLAVSGSVAVASDADGTTVAAPAAAPAVIDPAVVQAAGWLTDNAVRSDRLLVDSGVADVLADAGWMSINLVDPSRTSDDVDWQTLSYVVATPDLRASDSPLLGESLDNSLPVASFGAGDRLVEIRAVAADGAAAATDAANRRADIRASFGSDLAQNPAVVVSDADRALLIGGMVDDRISAVLGLVASQGDVVVAGFPEIPGEEGRPVRQVALTSVAGRPLVIDGQPSDGARTIVTGFLGRFSPIAMTTDDDRLLLRYTLPTGSATD